MSINDSATIQDKVSSLYSVLDVMGKECIPLRINESQFLMWNNPDSIISLKVEALAYKVKNLLLAFLYLVGGPANIINMAVFYKQGLQDRVNLCLFTLGASDVLFLTSALLLHAEHIYGHLAAKDVVATPFSSFMLNHNLVVLQAAGFVSYALSAIIACERCYCVLSPLKYQTVLGTRTMAAIIILVSVTVFSLFFLVSYRYWDQCFYDPVTGLQLSLITGGGLYTTHKELIDTLDGSVFGAGLPAGLMIVVITATTITTVKLRRIVAWRTETTCSLSPREVALTRMLIANSMFFIACLSPVFLVRTAYLFLPEMSAEGRYRNLYFTTLSLTQACSFINSSLNFFVYCSMGSRYRETLWALLCMRKQQEVVRWKGQKNEIKK